MTIVREDCLANFTFWCGAKALAEKLTLEELDRIESWMEDYKDIWDETEINDFFWFEDEIIAEILGYEDADALWDELLERI